MSNVPSPTPERKNDDDHHHGECRWCHATVIRAVNGKGDVVLVDELPDTGRGRLALQWSIIGSPTATATRLGTMYRKHQCHDAAGAYSAASFRRKHKGGVA